MDIELSDAARAAAVHSLQERRTAITAERDAAQRELDACELTMQEKRGARDLAQIELDKLDATIAALGG